MLDVLVYICIMVAQWAFEAWLRSCCCNMFITRLICTALSQLPFPLPRITAYAGISPLVAKGCMYVCMYMCVDQSLVLETTSVSYSFVMDGWSVVYPRIISTMRPDYFLPSILIINYNDAIVLDWASSNINDLYGTRCYICTVWNMCLARMYVCTYVHPFMPWNSQFMPGSKMAEY